MSNAVNNLAGMVSGYTVPVIDAQLVRQLLRVHRKRHFSNNRKAAEAAGLNPSTIAKIENMKRWRTYDPAIGIVIKLLDAMKIPLTDFVQELTTLDRALDDPNASERLRIEALPMPSAPVHDQLGSPEPSQVDRDEEADARRLAQDDIKDIEATVIRILARLLGRATEETPARFARQDPGPDRAASERVVRGQKRRRGATGPAKPRRPRKRN